jgi:DNA-binding beta-propeller fold protein YncE
MLRIALLLLAWPFATPAAPVDAAVTGRIAIGGESRWDYVFADPSMHRLYVSHGTQVEVVDTQTGKAVATIPDTPGVHGVAVAHDLGLGFVSDGRADRVTVFDLATFKPRSTIAVGANPDTIRYDPATHRVITFNGRSQNITFIDAAAGKVVGTVDAGGRPEEAVVAPDGHVWFNVEDTGELAELDPRAMKIVGRTSLAPCLEPSGLTVDDRGRLYSVCQNKLMMIVSPEGRVLGRAPIGAGPDGVAWLDGAAFSANGADGTVTEVVETKPGSFETVRTIATERSARTITADPAAHRLYLPAAELAPVAPVEGASRPGAVPGSFHVLVVEVRAGSGGPSSVSGNHDAAETPSREAASGAAH